MSEVYIVSSARTPIGSFMGNLATLNAPQLGSIAIKKVLEKVNITGEKINEVILGNVLSAGIGQAPARQSAVYAGLSKNVCCTTINKVCGSGLKAVMLSAGQIKNNEANLIIAGGIESMSNVPYLLTKARTGYRLGDGKIIDALIYDGLINVYDGAHMGNCAELCAKKYNFSRDEQDEFAINSYKKALKAQQNGNFKDEIAVVEITDRKGKIEINEDEEPKKFNEEKLKQLRAAFDKTGTITAGNASSINDGAASLLLASEDAINANNLKPVAKILGYTSYALEPEWFTIAPVFAIKNLLTKLNLKTEDIDLYEINEAFSVVTMSAIEELNLNKDKVNIYGGAVAIGHPIGASGARILVTLLNALKQTSGKKGIASLCIGGGEAVALAVEMV